LDYNFSTKENGDLSERILQRGPDLARASDERKELFEIPPKWIKEEETLLSIVKGPFVDNPPRELFWANVFTWGVYHDLRVDRDSAVRRDAVARSEKRVEPDGDNLINVLHTLYTTDRNFRDDIDGAMNAAFGDQFEELNFPPTADGRIQLRLRWKSLKREQSAADLSDGTLRFLYLLAILASPEPSPLIAIDEPETGLHPSMLGIIADFAIQAAERSQVILTTHSPAMLDAFNDKANPPTTTIATCENGETKLRIPPPDELKYWLKNYSLGQLFTSGELEQLGGVPA
jgi:predicted ATPase